MYGTGFHGAGRRGAAAGREENEPHEDNQPMSKMSNCYLDDSNDQWRLPKYL